MTASPFHPTQEQAAIVEAAKASSESLMVEAYAGTAKTTTLVAAAKAMRPSRALAVAFNTATAAELRAKLAGRAECKTFNALGFAAWRLAHPEVASWKVDGEKAGKLVTEALKGKRRGRKSLWLPVLRLVGEAQKRGLVVREGPMEAPEHEAWEEILDEVEADVGDEEVARAREVLMASLTCAKHGHISFDDMLWCPLHYGGKWARWDTILVDEAQDLSPENQRQLAAGLRPASRLLVFGDSRQAIYAFRGADADSMRHLRTLRPEWKRLRLTTTFRCPEAIVQRQRGHAPGFRAAPGAPPGTIFAPTTWRWEDTRGWLEACGGRSMAVLCRNNAPLFGLALRLLRQRIPVVLSGRGLGTVLARVIDRLHLGAGASIGSFLAALADWEGAEAKAAASLHRYGLATRIHEQADCLRAVAAEMGGGKVEALRSVLGSLCSPTSGGVVLSTIHKAKGLEWDLVLHLDPSLIPSRQAEMEGGKALQQEENLLYVAETRARRGLALVASDGWGR